MNTKRVRIVVSINTNGDLDVRAINRPLFKQDEASALSETLRASGELMAEVWPEFAYHTVFVDADVPMPPVVVDGTVAPVSVEKAGAK